MLVLVCGHCTIHPKLNGMEDNMLMLAIAEARGVTAEQDEETIKALNLEGGLPPGARVRLAGPTETGWRIVSLWDSRESFDAFFRERLTPTLEQLGRPVPDFEFWPIESVIIR